MSVNREFPAAVATPYEQLWRCLKCSFKKRAVAEPQCPNHPYSAMDPE